MKYIISCHLEDVSVGLKIQIVSYNVKQCHNISRFSRINVNQLIGHYTEEHKYSELFKLKPVDSRLPVQK